LHNKQLPDILLSITRSRKNVSSNLPLLAAKYNIDANKALIQQSRKCGITYFTNRPRMFMMKSKFFHKTEKRSKVWTNIYSGAAAYPLAGEKKIN
jgi:hypothetical protein